MPVDCVISSCLKLDCCSIRSDHADDDALDFDFVDDDGLVFVVGRLEAELAILFFVELFEGRFAGVEQGDDGLAVVGGVGFADDDHVAGADLFVDHGVAADFQDVGVFAVADIKEVFEVEVFLVFDGFDGITSCDGADQWQAGVAFFVGGLKFRIDFQRASLVGLPDNDAFFDERFDVFEYCNLADAQSVG